METTTALDLATEAYCASKSLSVRERMIDALAAAAKAGPIAKNDLGDEFALSDQPNTPIPGDLVDLAHKILGEFCACYAEAYPADTCYAEKTALAGKLKDWLSASEAASTENEPTPGFQLFEFRGDRLYDADEVDAFFADTKRARTAINPAEST